MIIKEGSRWGTTDNTVFVVIQTVEQDNHTWVHYRNEKTAQEYSCFQESFEARFRPLPE
jgi:hypothetical protein